MNFRHHGNQAAVHFFGKRIVDIAATQASLDVADGNFAIVSGQGRGEGGRGIALDKHRMGFKATARIFDVVQDAGR